MKRFIAVLSGLLVLPAFAEVAPVYYDEPVEYTDDMIDAVDDEVETEVIQQVVPQTAKRTTVNRSTSVSRALPASGSNVASRTNVSSRAVASSPRTTTSSRATASRAARTANIVSRPSSTTSRATVTSRGAATSKPVTARVGTSNNPVISTGRGVSYSSQQTLKDSGNALYNPSTVSRVGVANRRTASRLSTTGLTSNTPATPVITQEDVSTTTTNLTAITELTDYCKAQYAACMDNYCNVLDDNQGRCSCSKNLKNYEKTEQALKDATEKFQEVVQKIRYIGLTGEQIETLFTETEAEITMAKESDKSSIKNSLDSIKRKIVDVSTPNASSYETNSGLSFDMSGLLDANFTDGFDINAFLNTQNNTTSNVTNQRGEQLYKTATSRCKTAVLNSCTAQGIDANVITNSYDLEIDKQCIAYERSLNEANSEMKSNVTNAANILQQARLMLAQNRNSYDVRGCVAAIDACMQDEYVCGSDYELCLDPTGKYISNGEIVKGGTPGVSGGMPACEVEINNSNATTWLSNGMYELYQAWNYKGTEIGVKTVRKTTCDMDNNEGTNTTAVRNAWGAGQNETLGDYIDAALNNWKKNYNKEKTTEDMATYLLQKIGYIDENDKVHGMCASVMKQCQDYTYTSNKSKRAFRPDNEVVRQYLASTLTQIKLQQDALLSEYVEDCRSDVSSCLSTNGYDESNSTSTISQTAINACRADIQTCMSAGGWKPSDNTKLSLRQMADWVGSMLISCPENYYVSDTTTNGVTTSKCEACGNAKKYTYASNGDLTQGSTQIPLESNGGATTTCNCPSGYTNYYTEAHQAAGALSKPDGCIEVSSNN